MSEEPLLRWIPLLPLAVAAYHGVMVGIVRRATSSRFAILLSSAAIGLSFVVTLIAFFVLIDRPADSRVLVDSVTTWIGTGVGADRFTAELAFRLDPLTAMLAFFVCGLAFLIHGIAAQPWWGDRGAPRFYAELGLFTSAALIFVLSSNLVLMLLGFQAASVGQALLSGYAYEDRQASRHAIATLVLQRLGDLGFVLGLLFGIGALISQGMGTLDVSLFAERLAASPDLAPLVVGPWSIPRSELIAACFLLAAFARTAQGPFLLFWDRGVEGRPEAISLVSAGVGSFLGFALLLRLEPLWAQVVVVANATVWVGATTALAAAILAAAQRDLVKALASLLACQLGLTWVAIGSHAPIGALFHAVSMAFIHGLLFLCAGRVIDAMEGDTNLDRMGGLRLRLWQEYLLFGIGAFALAGVPLSSGFFSRNEVWLAASSIDIPGSVALMRILVLASSVSAFVAVYLHFRIFWGDSRALGSGADRLSDLDAWSSSLLWSLGVGVAVGGILGIPQAYGDLPIVGVEDSHSLRNLLAAQFQASWQQERPHAIVYGIAGVSTSCFVAAFWLARWLALAPPSPGEKLSAAVARIRNTLALDERIGSWAEAWLVRPLKALAVRGDAADRAVLARGLQQRLPTLLAIAIRTLVGRAQPARLPLGLLAICVGTVAMLSWVLK